MRPEEAFAALADRVGTASPRTAYFSEVELGAWPGEAVTALRSQKLLAKARPAPSTVCPGCEQQCVMPVERSGDDEHRAHPFIVCDKRSDIGRVAIRPEQLRQWRSDDEVLCDFVAACLGVRRTSTAADVAGLLNVGVAPGDRRSQMVALRAAGEPFLVVAASGLPLAELIVFNQGAFGLDVATIRRLIDSANTADDRHIPNTARREARKLNTQKTREEWRREYRRLRKANPNQSAVWYSQKIAKLEIGEGYAAETIRKQMTR